MTTLRDTGDEQDFDALSEESFDFGHFHELDSDVDEPQVDEDRLDPFTAAQREEAASQGGPDDRTHTPEADDQFSFTQKLLTNARTLKQLQESGAPEIEIAYENDQPATSQPSRSQKTARRLQFSDRVDDGSPFIVRKDNGRLSQPESQPSSSLFPTPRPSQKAQYAFDERSYTALQSEAEDTMIQGRYESFPAGMLREYSYEQVKRILEQTKHYHFASPSMSTHSDDVKDDICLSDLSCGVVDGDSPPLLCIMSREDEKLVLSDAHSTRNPPCTVFAVLPTAVSIELDKLTPGDYLIPTDFYFDHAAQLEGQSTPAKSRKVTVEEVEDAYFTSQDSFPDHLLQVGGGREQVSTTTTTTTTMTACSILVIHAYRSCTSAEWQTHLEHRRHRASSARQMFDSEVQPREPAAVGEDAGERVMTQDTVETNYSDGQFEERLDINDFPIE